MRLIEVWLPRLFRSPQDPGQQDQGIYMIRVQVSEDAGHGVDKRIGCVVEATEQSTPRLRLRCKVRAYPKCLIFSRRRFAATSGSFAP
jgi:hypothetical protein